MSANADETLVAFGKEIKALDDTGRIGGYGVLFSGPDEKDLEGTYFTHETNFGKHVGDGARVMMNHGIPMSEETRALCQRTFGEAKTHKDEVGIFAETVLDL